MCTNFDTTHALEVISNFLRYSPQCRDIDADPIICALAIIMCNNLFKFGDTHWLQITGTAMGPPSDVFATEATHHASSARSFTMLFGELKTTAASQVMTKRNAFSCTSNITHMTRLLGTFSAFSVKAFNRRPTSQNSQHCAIAMAYRMGSIA
jgi:hypothetical protein